MDHLLAARFSATYRIVDFRVTRSADFDMLAGEIRGYEIFYKATIEFPQGAHLDCEPAKGAARPEDCSDDPYFSLVRETRPLPGRQFVEAGGRRAFDEDFRFTVSRCRQMQECACSQYPSGGGRLALMSFLEIAA